MKGAPGGFTIIEVMIVLSISAVMLVSAATLFNGRRESTDFTQAMYDLQSQFQSMANGVSSHLVPGLQEWTCSPATVSGKLRPVLSSGSSTGKDCIYLGQAVQVAPGSPTIYSYPVFGLRTIGGTDNGEPPSSIAQANPEPAINSSDPTDPKNLLLISTYTMLNSLQVSSAKVGGTENDILSLYSSLQDNNTSGNEISVSATAYTGDPTDPPKTQIKKCIEANGCPADWSAVTGTTWNLCVSLSDNSRQAQLSLKGTATGIVTSLNMNGCS